MTDVEELGAEGGEPEADSVPKYELPADVKGALDEMLAALKQFSEAIPGYLDSAHSHAAELMASLEPPKVPLGLPEVEAQIAEWEQKVTAQTQPFKEFLARLNADCQPVRDYLVALRKLFEPPAPEAESGDGDGDAEEPDA